MSSFTQYQQPYNVLRRLVIADFKLRYQNSFLGYLWSLMKPLAMFAILYVVFVGVFNVGNAVPHYASYLLLGIICWNFFAEVTVVSLVSIVARGDLLRRIYFPRYTIVLSVVVSALTNLLLSMAVLAVLMVLDGVGFTWKILYSPLLFVELILISGSIGFILSALYVKLRDLNFIWDVVMQGAFYATPVVYPLHLLANRNELIAKIIIMNPLAQCLQDLRYVLISDHTMTVGGLFGNEYVRIAPLGILLMCIWFSWYIFRRRSPRFAENV